MRCSPDQFWDSLDFVNAQQAIGLADERVRVSPGGVVDSARVQAQHGRLAAGDHSAHQRALSDLSGAVDDGDGRVLEGLLDEALRESRAQCRPSLNAARRGRRCWPCPGQSEVRWLSPSR